MALKNLSIVVADSHRTSRQIVVEALGTVGIRDVRQAEDGGNAFQLICSRPPDIAFLEYEMPQDGLKTLSMVRRSARSPNQALPVVMMSIFADPACISALRDAGVTEIIAKPLSISKICSRVKAIVERPRQFINCAAYVGPCRRRRDDKSFPGPYKRASDNDFFESEIPADKSRNIIRFRS